MADRDFPIVVHFECMKWDITNLELLSKRFDIWQYPEPIDGMDKIIDINVLNEAIALAVPVGYNYGEIIPKFKSLRYLFVNSTSDQHVREIARTHELEVICLAKDPFLEHITCTAEHAMGLIHAVHRRTTLLQHDVRKHVWDRYYREPHPRMLSQMTLGIVGMGRLGKMVAKMAEPVFKYVMYYDQYEYDGPATRAKTLRDLYTLSDVVTFHGGEDLQPQLNDEDYKLIGPYGIIINTAQGAIIGLDKLHDKLVSGQIWGAGLDVAEHEQVGSTTSAINKIAQCPNAVVTPHIGGSIQYAWRATERRVVEKLIEAVYGEVE